MTSRTAPIRIVIADDHPVFRAGLRQVIAGDPRFAVVGEACDGQEALRTGRELRPEVMVLDLDMPRLDGLGVARELRGVNGAPHLVILTMHKRESLLNEALDLGVLGFVLKENAVTEMLECLKAAARGESWVSPSLSSLLLRRRHRRDELLNAKPSIELLTRSERRILGLIAENLTSREIAARLGISPLTVETHRKNISRKLELEGNHPLLQFALKHRSELMD
jgi:DNA-binding NarL/FixJ family response regulator